MIDFIVLSLSLSLLINGVYIIFNWDGMLFQYFGLSIEAYLPEWLCKMLFTCATCMSSIYGTACFLYFYNFHPLHWLAFLLVTASIATIINIFIECLKAIKELSEDESGRTIIF